MFSFFTYSVRFVVTFLFIRRYWFIFTCVVEGGSLGSSYPILPNP